MITSLSRYATAGLLLLALLPIRRAAAQTWLNAMPVTVQNSDPAAQAFYPQASVTDSVGNSYVTGWFQGTFALDGLSLNSGYPLAAEAFVGKISPAGVWQWVVSTHSLPPTVSPLYTYCTGSGITLDPSGNVIFSGNYSGRAVLGPVTLGSPLTNANNVFVAKLSPAGAWQWVAGATIRDSSNYSKCGASAIASSADGSIYLTGSLSGTVAFDSATLTTAPTTGPINVTEAYVAKLSPSGIWQWAAASTGSGSSRAGIYEPVTSGQSLVVDATGNATLMGYFARKVSFGRHAISRTDTINSTADLFVSRISPAGDWQWATHADSPAGGSGGADLTLTPSGSVLLTGAIYDSSTTFGATTLVTPTSAIDGTAFLASIASATGAWEWAVTASGAPGETVSYGQRVRAVAGGRILLTGGAGPPLIGLNQVAQPFVALYSATGTPLWRTQIPLQGETSILEFHSIQSTAPDEVRLTGVFTDTARFGTTMLRAARNSTSSLFVTRLNTRPLATAAEILAPPFTLAPNPAHETVQLTGISAAPVTLLDAVGRSVRTYSAGTNTLNLRGLAPGLYTVRAGAAVRRLVVE